MSTRKNYLDLVALLVHARPPKPRELRPCHQHELLLQLICRRKEKLTNSQLEDLVWNITNGPKKKKTAKKSRKRQCGGMDATREPTDAEVVFGCRERTPPPTVSHCGWGRSRIEWLRKLELQQRQYYQAWQEIASVNEVKKTGSSTTNKNEKTPSCKKDKNRKKDKGKARLKLSDCWSFLPFLCGRNIGKDSSCLNVRHRKKTP
ncbi:uncharacterized protein LOC108097338 [Drosophila ficusphila]|uniref:uncharacterized protein LOC108097338 n=1 Tax=Drosophila ficusphila TaxID=30025 RepID=UPI0007E5EB72|nr:uncharacterized protein LOC108097338 [Drosophila ficusphila]